MECENHYWWAVGVGPDGESGVARMWVAAWDVALMLSELSVELAEGDRDGERLLSSLPEAAAPGRGSAG